MNCRTALPLILIAAVSTGHPAAAQQTDVGEEEDVIVVTAQRRNATEVLNAGEVGALGDKLAENVPFTIRSYDESLILNQQPQTLGELLENDPTVRTTYGFGNAAEQFIIRGFPLFGDDVGLNGLYGIAPRQLVAPQLYSSVQVLNGASAFLNGAAPGGSGIGGSVNLMLKRAGPLPLTRATLNYNSDAQFGGSVDASRRFGEEDDFGLRLNAAVRSGEVAIEREERGSYVAGGSFDWNGGNARVALDLAFQEVRIESLRPKVTVATETIPAVPAADANYAQDFTFSELRDIFGVLHAEYDIAENALFHASAGFRDGSEEGIYGGITVLDAETGAASGSALLVPRTDNNEAVQAGVRVRLGEAVTHEINVGGNANWQTNRNAFDFLGGFGGYETSLYDTPQVPLPPSGFVGGDLDDPFPIAKTKLWSVYASDTLGFWGERVLLTGGLRVQTIRTKSFSYFGGGLDRVYEEDAVTPVAGIVVKPLETVSIYANYIEALEPGPIAPTDPIIANPGEAFAPIRSVQYEAGGKLSSGSFFVSLAAFRIDRPLGFSIPLDPDDPAGQQLFGLFGEQRNEGIEFTLNAEPFRGLRLIGGASVIDAQLRETAGGLNDGNDVPGVPDYLINANVEWDLPAIAGLTLTGRVVHTGGQPVNIANTLAIEEWTRFDLGARYVFAAGDRPVTLRLSIDNVADERYWASAFDVFSAALLQGAPRAVRASISASF